MFCKDGLSLVVSTIWRTRSFEIEDRSRRLEAMDASPIQFAGQFSRFRA
jgi:hypothetical protein